MTKTDKSKHDICLASIKRHTLTPYDFKWTRFYDHNSFFTDVYPGIQFDLTENELVICSTVIDPENYSVLTTQRIITIEKGVGNVGNLIGATNNLCGNFKGIGSHAFTFGLVGLINGTEIKYFIETGRASMVMIYGVRTIINFL